MRGDDLGDYAGNAFVGGLNDLGAQLALSIAANTTSLKLGRYGSDGRKTGIVVTYTFSNCARPFMQNATCDRQCPLWGIRSAASSLIPTVCCGPELITKTKVLGLAVRA